MLKILSLNALMPFEIEITTKNDKNSSKTKALLRFFIRYIFFIIYKIYLIITGSTMVEPLKLESMSRLVGLIIKTLIKPNK